MFDRNYYSVITNGLLLIIRVPHPKEPSGRQVWKALTPIMHAHSKLQKDIWQLDPLFHDPDAPVASDIALSARLAQAYLGNYLILPKHWLYDWDGAAFVVARLPDVG